MDEQAQVPQEQELETQWIKCVEEGCGIEFSFEAGEQQFYKSKGYPPPKRCKEHRKIHRARMKKWEEEKDKKAHRDASPFNPKNWKRDKGVQVAGADE